jgi:sugar phosphate isomerase/epimerase
MKRREFLGNAGLAATSMALPSISHGDRLDRVGIQLYTVRDLMAENSAGTLDAIAKIGYDEVEFAGFHDHSPAEVRAMLDNSGLDAPSAHVTLEVMRTDPAEIIDAAQVIGFDYLVLAWLAPGERETLDHYRRHAELCNRFGEQCKSAGNEFGYHNHEFEFEMLEGQRPMDLLLAETDADVMQIEMDLYWITLAGADPFEYFRKHPGRFPLCHVKDMATDRSMVDVGTGVIDFASIFADSEQAGLRHYFVEHDNSPDPMAAAARSYAELRKLEY